MSEDKKIDAGKTQSTDDASVITIDLKPFIGPVSMVLSAAIIGISLVVSSNTLASNLKNITVAGGTTTGTTTGTTGAVTASLDQIKGIFSGDFLKFGNPESKVLLVEFSDTSCPYCSAASGHNPELNKQMGTQFILKADGGTYVAPVPEMKKMVDEGKAAFAWIYTTGHGNGKLAAQALYCANEKGKFWEVHDKLMTAEGYALQNDVVKNDVTQAGKLSDFLASAVDKDFLKGCLESGKYAERPTKDEQFAASIGVSGTPGFFLNDKNFAGAYSWADMSANAVAYQ
jgi:protein-disulfide isomerase